MMGQGNAFLPTLNIGGRIITDLQNLIILYGECDDSTNLYATLRKQDGVAGYTPAAQRKFVVIAYEAALGSVTAAAAHMFRLHYQDNDVGINATTVPTNPVYIAGSQKTTALGSIATLQEPGAGRYAGACDFQLPAAKYLGIQNLNNFKLMVKIYGYDVAV